MKKYEKNVQGEEKKKILRNYRDIIKCLQTLIYSMLTVGQSKGSRPLRKWSKPETRGGRSCSTSARGRALILGVICRGREGSV